MPFDLKFDLVSESHQFSYQFFILSVGIAQNACVYTNELDSKSRTRPIGVGLGYESGLSLVIFRTEHCGLSPHNFKEPGKKQRARTQK